LEIQLYRGGEVLQGDAGDCTVLPKNQLNVEQGPTKEANL
jgi:hypothetical protein